MKTRLQRARKAQARIKRADPVDALSIPQRRRFRELSAMALRASERDRLTRGERAALAAHVMAEVLH